MCLAKTASVTDVTWRVESSRWLQWWQRSIQHWIQFLFVTEPASVHQQTSRLIQTDQQTEKPSTHLYCSSMPPAGSDCSIAVSKYSSRLGVLFLHTRSRSSQSHPESHPTSAVCKQTASATYTHKTVLLATLQRWPVSASGHEVFGETSGDHWSHRMSLLMMKQQCQSTEDSHLKVNYKNWMKHSTATRYCITRMWANAQCDGQPAKYR